MAAAVCAPNLGKRVFVKSKGNERKMVKRKKKKRTSITCPPLLSQIHATVASTSDARTTTYSTPSGDLNSVPAYFE